jgi:hypothetical protein
MTFEHFNVKQLLLGIICLKGRTMDQEIFNSSYSFVTKSNVPLHKLVFMITDGANSMSGQVNGFIALCRQHDDLPDFLSYHIIHHQAQASKRLVTKTEMDITIKIVNSIRGRSLQRRLFNLSLQRGVPDIMLCRDVRWLSRYKLLQQIFLTLLSEYTTFLKDRGYMRSGYLIWHFSLILQVN